MDGQLKRLETVTNRLEAVVQQLSSAPNQPASNQSDASNDVVEDSVNQLPIIRDYDAIINESVKQFVDLSQKLGGDLTTMTEYLTRLFNAQQQFLRQAVQSKKPDESAVVNAIQPQSNEMTAIAEFRDKNRKSPFFNHLSAISEGIPAFSWILVAQTPAPHIKDMTEAAQFYSNRVLKDYKEKDPTHAEWVKLWAKVLADLQAYVRKYHTTGLAWASQGKREFGSVNTITTTAKSATPPASGGPPPPPPPPPPPALLETTANTTTDDGRNELMSSITSLGESVTAGLKKVPDELKTHKNPQLRQQAATPPAPNARPVPPPRTGKIARPQAANTPPPANPPKLALEGNKWVVEYQTDKSDLRITDTKMQQSIYVYKCTNSTIVVEGKVNSIVLDQCNKVGLQFTSVVSLIDIINCKSMKAQVIERVPTIQIEKTDGCHIYLSSTSLDTEFITSKSSEMSVNLPIDDNEYKEYPIPEQFKTSLKNGNQLVTVPNESAGV